MALYGPKRCTQRVRHIGRLDDGEFHAAPKNGAVCPAAQGVAQAGFPHKRYVSGRGVPCQGGLRLELQRQSVHAVAATRSAGRAVVEQVAEMSAAAAAMDFVAIHAERRVVVHGDGGVGQWLPETRPAGAAVELGLAVEQLQVAAGAGENADAVLVEQRRGAGIFGALAAHDVEGVVAEDLAPFVVGVGHLEGARNRLAFTGDGAHRRCVMQETAPRTALPPNDAYCGAAKQHSTSIQTGHGVLPCGGVRVSYHKIGHAHVNCLCPGGDPDTLPITSSAGEPCRRRG